MNDLRLLMICGNPFERGWGGPLPRLVDISLGLKKLGWNIELVMSKQRHRLETEFPADIVHTPFGSYPGFFDHRGLRYLYRWLRRWTPLKGIFHDPRTYWGRRVITWSALAQAVRRPSIIWAVSRGELDSLIIGQLLKDQFQTPLVIELQDPVPDPGDAPFDAGDWQHFQKILARASTVITTTKSLAEYLEKNFQVKAIPVYLSYGTAMPESLSESPRGERFVMLHAGFLHGGKGRTGVDLVKGLSIFFRDHPEAAANTHVYFLGAGRGGPEVVRLARKLGLGSNVAVRPQVSRDECYREMAKADVLVVIKFRESKFDMQIPGKLYDYFHFRKPILGLMGENSEAAQMLRQSGLGVVVRNGDHEGIAQSLFRLWQSKRLRATVSYRLVPNERFLRQFSREANAGKINRLLRRLLREG
jgi:glycosyltransferase involved in cell wall biosynthesis